MKILHFGFDPSEAQAPRIAFDLTAGLNVVDARQPLLARQLADLAGHVLYGARVCDRDSVVHDHPGYLEVESSLGRFRLERHADRVNRGTYTEPRLTVAALDGRTAQPNTARELLGGISPEVASRMMVLRDTGRDQLEWLLSESFAAELRRLERTHPNRRVETVYGDHDLFAVRDRISHQIELLLAEKRRSSEALEAALQELDREARSVEVNVAEARRELDDVLARLAELETQLRYHELSQYVGRETDEAIHSDHQPLLAGLDEEIAMWRGSLSDLEERESQVRHQISQLHPDDSSPLLPLADQRAALLVAQRLVADLDSEVALYARPSDSQASLYKHAHARLHPLVDTLGQQIEKLNHLVEQYEAAVIHEQLKTEIVHLERSQHELRATIDHLLDRRESLLRTSRVRTTITSKGELPADWKRLHAEWQHRRDELTAIVEDADRHLQDLAARRDHLHRERAELMNDQNLAELRRQLDEINRRIDSHTPYATKEIGLSVAPWRASDILAKLTDGRLREVRLSENGRHAGVVDGHGHLIDQHQLGDVDLRLLTISLQLAAVAGAAAWGLRLPVLVAEPFAELPEAELAILALVLEELGQAGHQVLMPTASSAVIDRLRSAGHAILSVDSFATQTNGDDRLVAGIRAYRPKTTTTTVVSTDENPGLALDDSIERFAVFGEDTFKLFSAIGIQSIRELLAAEPSEISRELDRTGISESLVTMWQTHVAMLVHVPELTLPQAQVLTSSGVRSLDELANEEAGELAIRIEDFLNGPRGVRYRSQASAFRRPILLRWIDSARESRALWNGSDYAKRSIPTASGTKRTKRTRKTRTRSTRQTQRPLRFRLSLGSAIVDAPSIGPKTAKRLRKIGIKTVTDFLEADCEQLALELDSRHITNEKLVSWQHQTQLMCRVPELLVRDAQILVGSGFTTPEGIASAEAADLWEFTKSFVATPEGTRVLRGADAPDLERVQKWIYWAENRRTLEAA